MLNLLNKISMVCCSVGILLLVFGTLAVPGTVIGQEILDEIDVIVPINLKACEACTANDPKNTCDDSKKPEYACKTKDVGGDAGECVPPASPAGAACAAECACVIRDDIVDETIESCLCDERDS